MIDAFKTLGWLNSIDKRSHLKKEDRRLIETIGKLGLFDFRIEPILEILRSAAHSSLDPLRKAEALLWCAAVGHARRWCPQAARDAREAIVSYNRDHHRQAVALWILGIVQWEMLQNHEAYRNWAEARRIFKQCQSPFQPSPQINDWYKEPVWQMEVELIARPEEISTWLNRFGRSSLSPSVGQVITGMRARIRQQAYPNIYILMQDLQDAIGRSERAYERAEIYLEFGLATYQIGNSHFAIHLLRQAILNFYPGIGTYHKQVVARCMLGGLEWMHKSLHNQAAADWLRCIDELDDLRWRADCSNRREEEEWYSERCDILRSALLEWLEPPKQSDACNGTPKVNGSKPSVPNAKKTYPYDDLLRAVGWDPATADRLIELERKNSPNANQNELIRRAIERLLRDR
jgi:hypothetical protein